MSCSPTPERSHTPGPWEVVEFNPEFREGYSVDSAGGQAVVGTCCGAGIYRLEDARLIAAAPDLLAACKTLVTCILALNNDDAETRRDFPELAPAEAAIARAEGMAVRH